MEAVKDNPAARREMVSNITGQYVDQKLCGGCRKPRGEPMTQLLNPIALLAPSEEKDSRALQDLLEDHLQALSTEDRNRVSDPCECGSKVSVRTVKNIVVPTLLLCVVSRNSPRRHGVKLKGIVTVDGGFEAGGRRFEVLACGLHNGGTEHGHYVASVRACQHVVRFNDGHAR